MIISLPQSHGRKWTVRPPANQKTAVHKFKLSIQGIFVNDNSGMPRLECSLIYSRSMIILKLRLFKEVTPMAQRRAEKPKKVKVSQKQQEFYSRLKSSKR